MGFWSLKRKNETPEERAARKARQMQRDAVTYDSIMSAFVQPLPTFSQWTAPVPRGTPPTYENVAPAQYYPATYYPNQSYENPYHGYQYAQCGSNTGSVASTETLPTYVDSTYNPYSRQMCLWQLPPFLLFGIYMAFVHPLFRGRFGKVEKGEDEDFEDPVIKRLKRRIEVKWGFYCILSLCVWIFCIVGIVVLILRTTSEGEEKKIVSRWVAGQLLDTWKVYY